MLMRWISMLPQDTDDHKLIVFLVPTVALVDQQSEHIANNTSLRVRAYRGDMRMWPFLSCLV
jgi:replicative superfamily II helicase